MNMDQNGIHMKDYFCYFTCFILCFFRVVVEVLHASFSGQAGKSWPGLGLSSVVLLASDFVGSAVFLSVTNSVGYCVASWFLPRSCYILEEAGWWPHLSLATVFMGKGGLREVDGGSLCISYIYSLLWSAGMEWFVICIWICVERQ